MDRRGHFFEVSSVGAFAKQRLGHCTKLVLASLVLPCLALGQPSTPTGSHDHVGAIDTQTTVSSPDGNAPITRNQAAALLEEMRRLEILLESRGVSLVAPNAASDAGANSAKASVTMPLRADEHALGDPAAPIVMVEFADLQCPFCKDFQASTFPDLDSAYIKTGKVRFVVRDLPLSSHPYARPAAEAVRCAEEQGKYWELRSALLKESAPPSPETTSAVAAGIHLEMNKFEECQNLHTFSADIEAEKSEAARLGIKGTPAFLIGQPQDGKIIGIVIQGSRTIDVYRREIERILNEGAEHKGTLVGPDTNDIHPNVKPT